MFTIFLTFLFPPNSNIFVEGENGRIGKLLLRLCKGIFWQINSSFFSLTTFRPVGLLYLQLLFRSFTYYLLFYFLVSRKVCLKQNNVSVFFVFFWFTYYFCVCTTSHSYIPICCSLFCVSAFYKLLEHLKLKIPILK